MIASAQRWKAFSMSSSGAAPSSARAMLGPVGADCVDDREAELVFVAEVQ